MYIPSSHTLDTVVTILPMVICSFQWWLDSVTVRKGVPFASPTPSMLLVIDVSDMGQGAHLGPLKTQGLWSVEELSLHINLRELRAIHLACQAFRPNL